MSEPRPNHFDPPAWAQWGVLLASIFLIWNSLGSHPLFPPDEGRYASVSGWMATHSNWLQPQLRDHLHVTKPPLTYWAQALSIRAFGHTEFAVRFPSALASTISVLALFLFARRAMGALVATIAVGVLASMPLFQILGGLAITDPLLSAWWLIALSSAWYAISAGRSSGRRHFGWITAFWFAVALVGLTKGPLLFAPPVIVCLWLIFARRLREIRFLLPSVGLPLAVAPLAAVAYLFWQADPIRAAHTWNFEFIDRFTGEGGHNDPWWGLIIPFCAGLFPATTMLTLPWLNLSPARAWACFTQGDLRALLLTAVVLPFIGFSMLSGQSPTYLLPLAAPLAWLVAMMLASWVDGTIVDLPAGYKAPDVRFTNGIALTGLCLSLMMAAVFLKLSGWSPAWATGWTLLVLTLPLLAGMFASWIAIWWWPQQQWRLPALGVYFLGFVVIWMGFRHAEGVAMTAMGSEPVARFIEQEPEPVLVFRLQNLTIDWYLKRWLEVAVNARELAAWMEEHPDGRVLLSASDYTKLQTSDPTLAKRLHPEQSFAGWPMKELLLCDTTAAE